MVYGVVCCVECGLISSIRSVRLACMNASPAVLMTRLLAVYGMLRSLQPSRPCHMIMTNSETKHSINFCHNNLIYWQTDCYIYFCIFYILSEPLLYEILYLFLWSPPGTNYKVHHIKDTISRNVFSLDPIYLKFIICITSILFHHPTDKQTAWLCHVAEIYPNVSHYNQNNTYILFISV